MPQVPNLPSGSSTVAFTVPPFSAGFLVWSEQTVPLRIRWNGPAAASGADMGVLLPAGSATAPTWHSREFQDIPAQATQVQIFHAGGSTITGGVGFEILT